jgi:hypothetical protein
MQMLKLTAFHMGVLTAGLVMTAHSGALWAEPQRPSRLVGQLQNGMSFGEVATLLGSAPEKHEYEVKRRSSWHYAFADLIFEGGRLVSWSGPSGSENQENGPQNPPAEAPQAVKISPEAEALLNQILKEIPSDSDSAAQPGGPAVNAAPVEMNPPQLHGMPPEAELRLKEREKR